MTIEQIQLGVAARFRRPVGEMIHRGRTAEVVWPRQVAMYIAREHAAATFPVIGRAFRRDHATVMHAHRLVKRRIANDPEIRETVAACVRHVMATKSETYALAAELEARRRVQIIGLLAADLRRELEALDLAAVPETERSALRVTLFQVVGACHFATDNLATLSSTPAEEAGSGCRVSPARQPGN